MAGKNNDELAMEVLKTSQMGLRQRGPVRLIVTIGGSLISLLGVFILLFAQKDEAVGGLFSISEYEISFDNWPVGLLVTLIGVGLIWGVYSMTKLKSAYDRSEKVESADEKFEDKAQRSTDQNSSTGSFSIELNKRGDPGSGSSGGWNT